MTASSPERSAVEQPIQTDVGPSSGSVADRPSVVGRVDPPAASASTSLSQVDQVVATTAVEPKVSAGPLTTELGSIPSQSSSQNIPTSNTTSTISSVDDEVPPPRSGAPSALLSEASVLPSRDSNVPGRKPSISSLNPSSSRYMLRIPLLGRPKVPLDQVVAAAHSEEGIASGTSASIEGTLSAPTLPQNLV